MDRWNPCVTRIIVIFSIEEEKGVTVGGHSWSSIEVESINKSREDWEDRVPMKGKINLAEIKKEIQRVADSASLSSKKTTAMVPTTRLRNVKQNTNPYPSMMIGVHMK